MGILLSAHRLEKHFAARTLFSGLTFAVHSGDRIGLVGPNGAGKSTILRVLAGKTNSDGGELSLAHGLRVGYLEQSPEFAVSEAQPQTVREAVASATSDPWDPTEIMLVEETLARFDLDGDLAIEDLSGGWKKRVALARELVRRPDLLLLDEPTNHLDVEAIQWLEDFLAAAPFATIAVTHDRLFLQRVASRIFDLDPKLPMGLLTIEGTYADYLEARQGVLAAQLKQETTSRNTLRRETEWLRRGAKARQTKQKARIERAGDLKSEVAELGVRNQSRSVRIDFQEAERNPQRLIEAKGISKTYAGNAIFKNLDVLIGPKTRLGLLGPNGAGKSTLIRVLIGEEEPDTGTVKSAEKIQAAYFQQHRQALDPRLTVLAAICPAGDYVEFRGQPVYGRSYLSRFLFRSEQMDMPIEKLSGGEQARLRIAQLMLLPSNVLVLDEPTNDLDAATLDVLEEQLRDFNGAVILVTHDRYFLDQVSNQILAFARDEKDEPCLERFADFSQWEEWVATRPKRSRKQKALSQAATASAAKAMRANPRMSFKDQREMQGMEARIQAAELKLSDLQRESGLPENVANAKKLARLFTDTTEAKKEVDGLYARWSELEATSAANGLKSSGKNPKS